MSLLRYRAATAEGHILSGETEATPEQLRDQLEDCGLRLLDTEESRAGKRVGKRWSDLETAELARDLATVVSTGVALGEGLRDIATQANPTHRELLTHVVDDVERGRTLADSLARCGARFPDQFLAAVRAGERSGTLEQVLNRLAEFLEWRAALRSSLIPALAYPAGLLLAALGLILLVALYLVPKIAAPMRSSQTKLPWVTEVTLAVSDGLASYGPLLGALLAAVAVGYVIARRFETGRRAIDGAILNIPIVGGLVQKAAGADFASSLGTLYRAGLPFPESLELIARSTSNRAMSARVADVREDVLTGITLAEAVRRRLQLPPLVGRQISMGEHTGTLDKSLDRIAAQLERDLRLGLKRLVAIAEPAALCFAGAGVGFAIFAAVLPMFRMLEAIRR